MNVMLLCKCSIIFLFCHLHKSLTLGSILPSSPCTKELQDLRERQLNVFNWPIPASVIYYFPSFLGKKNFGVTNVYAVANLRKDLRSLI